MNGPDALVSANTGGEFNSFFTFSYCLSSLQAEFKIYHFDLHRLLVQWYSDVGEAEKETSVNVA